MEKVKVTCKACGKEVERSPKEPPKTPKEKKQIHFICPGCGAKNLRDGTAIYTKNLKVSPKDGPQDTTGQPQEPERKPTDGDTKDKNKEPQDGPEKSSGGFTFFD